MSLDAVVVGAGPNGLAAAITLARAGLAVRVIEAADEPGGGCRSGEITLPGFVHDQCSSVHPMGLASPFYRSLGLERHGLAWIHPPAELAHVMPDGSAVLLERSLDATCARLGRDGESYRRLLEPFVTRFAELVPMVLAPPTWPRSPVLMARFGLQALRTMVGLAGRFDDDAAPALLGGIAAHAMLRLDAPATAAFALVLAAAGHAVGWPLAKGGSQAITRALVASLREHGGELELGHEVRDLRELPAARAVLLDVTPRQLVAIAGTRLSATYRGRLARFRYGCGVCKVDWALAGPVPWRDARCARAGTVHLSGRLEDIAAAEDEVHEGRVAAEPFLLFVQPSLFDETRAPPGKQVGWAYCHVPNGSAVDAAALIEAHIERHAPGFRALILGRHVRTAVEMERYNPNYVGGDINGGSPDVAQMFTRPVAQWDPYAAGAEGLFLCSSSTPPGGGVHGMCGYHAAQSALTRVFRR